MFRPAQIKHNNSNRTQLISLPGAGVPNVYMHALTLPVLLLKLKLFTILWREDSMGLTAAIWVNRGNK